MGVHRSRTGYSFVLGATAGALAVGLALPFIHSSAGDSRPATSGASSLMAGPGGSRDPEQRDGASTALTDTSPEDGAAAPSAEAAGNTPRATSRRPHPSASSAEPATASGTVRVGILLLNIGNIARFGFGGGPGLGTEEQERVWQAYIDDVNAAGGVHGRRIEPVYETYDVLSPDDMRRACLVLTRDAKVFLVVDGGGYTGPSVLCVTKESRRPLLLTASSGIPDEYYRESEGLLFTLFQAGGRAMRNTVAALPRTGVKKDATVGILSDHYGGIKETPDQLHAALEDEGYTVAYRGDLSGDLHTGTTQIPLTVQQMRTRGVNVVVNIANAVYATQFVQEASNQGWHPHYVSADWNGASTDFYNQNMPSTFDGNHTITITRINEGRAGRPNPAIDVACTKRAEAALGTTVERDTDAYGLYIRLCSMAGILRRALEATGPDLTVEHFTTATERLGGLELAGFGGGSYEPGRHDAADRVRVMRWTGSCRCQMPIDDFQPTRH